MPSLRRSSASSSFCFERSASAAHERDARLGHRAVGGIQHGRQRRQHVLRGLHLVLAQHRETRGLLGGGALGLELALQRVGLGVLGADALAGGLEVDAALHLGGACGLELEHQGVAG